jgi:hypothetical protein
MTSCLVQVLGRPRLTKARMERWMEERKRWEEEEEEEEECTTPPTGFQPVRLPSVHPVRQ